MELLNVYAITSDGTKVEASANTVGAVPQGQIATKDKAGLFKIGENKYKFYVNAWDSGKTDTRQLYVWVNNNNYWYDTDRLVWSSSEKVAIEMVSSTDDTGTITNAVCVLEDYNGNKCIKVTYTWSDTVLTAYVDGSTGETSANTWVQVNDKGEAFVETQSVDIATNSSAGIVMPNANNFTIDSSTGDLQLNLATDTTRGGIKVEKTDISGAKELTLIQFGSGDGYTCLMVFPKLDVELVQEGLQINSTSYDDTTIDGQYETSDYSCIFLNGGQRKTVSKWWFDDQTIVWEDWEDGTQYKLSSYTITSVQHVKVYRIYRFKAYDSNNSITYLLDIIAGLDQETCASDQEISDYVCKYDADYPNPDPALSDTYQYYLAYDGSYHPGIQQYTRGAQVSSFDTTWLCRFGNEMGGILKGSLTDLIEDRAGSSGDYLIKDNTVTSGGYRFYFQDVSNGLAMYSPVYLKNDFHDYAEYAQYAAAFSGSATENRVILNDKEQPIVDIDQLNITQKVQTIIDNYHTPKIASTTQLGHVQAGVNTDGYKVTDLKYTDITGDADGNVAQYTGTVTDNGNNYEIIVKSKSEHTGVTKLGYKFTNNDQTVWTSVLSDIGIPTITFVEEDNYYYLRVTITSSATSTEYTLGSNVTEDGTKRYVDVDSNGIMSYLIPNQEQQKVTVEDASNTVKGVLRTGETGYWQDIYDDEAYTNKIGSVEFNRALTGDSWSLNIDYKTPQVLNVISEYEDMQVTIQDGKPVVTYDGGKTGYIQKTYTYIYNPIYVNENNIGLFDYNGIVTEKFSCVIKANFGSETVSVALMECDTTYDDYATVGSGVNFYWRKPVSGTIIRILDGYTIENTTFVATEVIHAGRAYECYTFRPTIIQQSTGKSATGWAASAQYNKYPKFFYDRVCIKDNYLSIDPERISYPIATPFVKGMVRIGNNMEIDTKTAIINPKQMSMHQDGIWSTEELETYETIYVTSFTNSSDEKQWLVTRNKPYLYYGLVVFDEKETFDVNSNPWMMFSKINSTGKRETSTDLGFSISWTSIYIILQYKGGGEESESRKVYYPVVTTYTSGTTKSSYRIYDATITAVQVKRRYKFTELDSSRYGGDGIEVLSLINVEKYTDNGFVLPKEALLQYSDTSAEFNEGWLCAFRSYDMDNVIHQSYGLYTTDTNGYVCANGNLLYLTVNEYEKYTGSDQYTQGEYAAKPTPNRVIMGNGLSGNHCLTVDVDTLDIDDKVKTIVDNSVKEATDTTLGTVKYGYNGYKYYAYADDTSTGIVVSKKIVEVTTNILHTSYDATTKEATWLQTKPTFTFHEIPDSGFTITDVSIVQSGTSAIKVFKFSIAYTDSSGTSGTTILQATGSETCTYGMVNKSSVTGQMMTDMTFLPDFIVAEMKKHTESWTFTLEDDSTITHNVVVLDD